MEIGIEELISWHLETSILLIDVREKHEYPRLDDKIFSVHPMSDFHNWRLKDFPFEKIVLICQHGIRSLAAAENLHELLNGTKNFYSLKGGITKWKKELEKIS